MKQHLKYILLILFFLGTLQQSIAQTAISSSVTLTQTVLNGYTWPVTVNGGSVGSPVIVTLGEDVTLSNALNYFIINGDYVTIEGNNKTIILSGVSNYLGLIKNGKSTANGFNNLTIQNLGVLSNSSSGNINAGWIGQQYFSKNATNNLVINCYSNGTIGRGMGGIVGQKSSGTVQNCYSSGSMNDGGGIFGNLASYGTAINCFSTGNIISGGGIYGYGASNSTATNCYSAGAIGSYGGGIYGTDVSNSTATNCYSAGSISTNGGGIYGINASNTTTTNCYSANGTWVSNDANTALTGEDGTVWNTNTSPYTLIAFATLISTNTSIDQVWIDRHINNLPILLDANVTLTILENLIFTNVNCYFALKGNDITIDGNAKTITITDISNYRGLVNNGNYLGSSWSSGYTGSIVKSIGILNNNSSLSANCGWIGQQGYGNGAGFSITKCYSNGDMTNDNSGGILGQAYMNGTISNCYSLGNISGNYTAGIVASSNQDASRIINCYSNGSITGSNANGISEPDMMMMYMPGMGGGVSYTNCYAANGTFNTTTANANLTGTDGTIWNTSTTPYTLIAFNPISYYNNLGLIDTRATSAAYSLRLLYPNYAGPLARININGSFYDVYADNSSGKIFSLNSTISNSYNAYNATTTGATSNLLSSILSSNTTASVAIWYDQSGNNVHAEQSNTNAQPRIINAGTIDHKNGYPAITFQREYHYLETVSNLTVQTINAVRALPYVYYQTLVAMPANTNFSVKGDYTNLYKTSPDQSDWSYGTSPNNTWVNGNQNVNYSSNNMHTAIIAAQNPITSNLSISSTFSQTGMTGGAFLNELVLFPDNLTSLERTTIENNQLQEYTIGFITSDINPGFQTVALNGTPKNLSITSSIISATYQWYSNSNNNNSGGTLINGATNNTYTPETTNDGDLYYYVIVSANNKTLASEVSLVRTVIITGSINSIHTLGSNEYPESLISDVNGNIYFLNRDNSSGNNIYTIKMLDIYGTLTSIATITSISNSNYFQTYNLIRDNNGNFYYQSIELVNNSYYNYTINKIEANGNVSIMKSISNGSINSMILDNTGNLYYILNESSNYYINKINTNGISTNLLTSSGNNIGYNNIKIDIQGNVYFLKYEYASNSSSNSIIKIDNNGNNLVSLVSLTGTNSSSYYIGRNINNFEILNSGEIKFIQQNEYYNGNQSTQSLQIKKIDSYGNVIVLNNDSSSSTKNSYTYISNYIKDNLDNIFYSKVSYIQNNQEFLIYHLDILNNRNIMNIYDTYISSITSDNKGNIYYSLPDLHQIIKSPVGVTSITLKWGLSPNGLKTQDNTIQLNINGKKGTTTPVNENGKVN